MGQILFAHEVLRVILNCSFMRKTVEPIYVNCLFGKKENRGYFNLLDNNGKNNDVAWSVEIVRADIYNHSTVKVAENSRGWYIFFWWKK